MELLPHKRQSLRNATEMSKAANRLLQSLVAADALGRTALQTAILQGNESAVDALEKVSAARNEDQSLRSHP
jgi:hypothetical protein